MKVSKLLDILQTKYKLTDEVKVLVNGETKDIEEVIKRKADNPRFLQHQALFIPHYDQLL